MSSYTVALRTGASGDRDGKGGSHLAVFDEQMIRLSRGVAKTVGKRHRKHFTPIDEKQYHPPPFVDLPIGLSLHDVDQFFREQRLDELADKLRRAELELGDPDIRPPSPPPAYDRSGNRTNARETRVKASMQKEYHRLIASMVKRLGDAYVPPLDYKPPKLMKRVEIPQDRYPDVNFTGMILGPRGLNHRRCWFFFFPVHFLVGLRKRLDVRFLSGVEEPLVRRPRSRRRRSYRCRCMCALRARTRTRF